MKLLRRLLLCFFAGLCINLATSQETEAGFELSLAQVSDVQDPDGNFANMAAGAFSGNDADGGGSSGVAQLIASFGNLGWDFEDDIDFAGDVTSGTFALPISVTGPFAIALKAADFYSLYKFDGSYSVGDLFDFTTAGVAVNSKNGQSPGLSHFSIYTTPAAVVPEASSLLVWGILVSICLGSATWWQRRQSV